jgi:hypothetical protein
MARLLKYRLCLREEDRGVEACYRISVGGVMLVTTRNQWSVSETIIRAREREPESQFASSSHSFRGDAAGSAVAMAHRTCGRTIFDRYNIPHGLVLVKQRRYCHPLNR